MALEPSSTSSLFRPDQHYVISAPEKCGQEIGNPSTLTSQSRVMASLQDGEVASISHAFQFFVTNFKSQDGVAKKLEASLIGQRLYLNHRK